MDFVKETIFNPLLHDALVALAIAGAAFSLLVFLKVFASRRLKAFAAGTPTHLDDLLSALIQRIARPYLLVVAVYLGAMTLDLPPAMHKALGQLLVVSSLIQVALLGSRLLVYWTDRYKAAKTGADATQQTTVAALGFIARIALWSILVLLMLENINFEIVYWVLSADHSLHMDIQQAILLAIFRRFQKEGVALAYPTQTIFVHADATPEGRKLSPCSQEALA